MHFLPYYSVVYNMLTFPKTPKYECHDEGRYTIKPPQVFIFSLLLPYLEDQICHTLDIVFMILFKC